MVVIENGLLCTSKDHFIGDLVIDGDRIVALTPPGEGRKAVPAGAEFSVVDATGKYVVPGGIDPHTHFDLQQSPKYRACDDFYSGGVAAACGGTTMVIDHMAFGPKGCDLHHQFGVYKELAEDCPIDYSFHGVFQHINDSILQELAELVTKEGFPSFKAYTTYGYPMFDKDLYQILKVMKATNGLLTVHAENDTITNERRNALKPGEITPYGQATTRPNEAESISVATLLGLAKANDDAPVYVVHLSAHESLEEVRLARRDGQRNIFVETCPQYLLLTDDKFKEGGPEEGIKYMLAPPLRKKQDNDALWAGLDDGSVQVVATDHCPFTIQEKLENVDDFRRCPGGVSGVEERMPLLFSEGVLKNRLTPERFVQVTATNAARIFGIPNKGDLKVGYDADIVIFDPEGHHEFTAETLKTTCGYSPYEGISVRGAIEQVWLRGKLIAKNNQFCGTRGAGRLVARRR